MTQSDKDVLEILRLAHELSLRHAGTQAMYDANKIVWAAWALQETLTGKKPRSAE